VNGGVRSVLGRRSHGADSCARSASALAIEAGVDILTIANQQVFEADIVRRTIDIVAGHVASGRIGEERIDQAHRRIRELKGA
jgi:beta-glucosidase-like glycosyl hydrolase